MDSSSGASGGLSFLTLLWNADPIVQGVMLLLAFASVICWAIAMEKLLRLVAFSRQLKAFERLVASPATSEAGGEGWLAKKFQSLASSEPSEPGEPRSEFQSRIERSLQIEASAQINRLQSALSFLATVGSTAPFIGLFGTVWGIMRSFTGIAAAKDTSLAVVAPGIAEALFATAIGLVAAIPAVIFYNQINVSLSQLADRMSVAAIKLAKAHAYGSKTQMPEPQKEVRVLRNGGMDAR